MRNPEDDVNKLRLCSEKLRSIRQAGSAETGEPQILEVLGELARIAVSAQTLRDTGIGLGSNECGQKTGRKVEDCKRLWAEAASLNQANACGQIFFFKPTLC